MSEGGEDKRLAALKRLSILDTAEEARFDALTDLAAFTFKVPVALISLIDSDRQWFKSRHGFEPKQTGRDIAFCDYAIRSDEVLVVPNALKDERFKNNPLVVGEPGIRFYAGAPLKTPDGHRIGTICVIDYRPRAAPTEAMKGRLKVLAASVMKEMLAGAPSSEPSQFATVEKHTRKTGAKKKLKRLEWAFNAYTRATSSLLHSGTLDSVSKNVCEALVEDDTYPAVYVALADHSPAKTVRIIARAGRATDYVDGLNLTWSNERTSGQGPAGRAIRSGLPEFVVDTLDDPAFSPWREKAMAFGIRSSVTIPFSRGDSIAGVLAVYGNEPNAFGPQEMSVFQQLGEELAFALALESNRREIVEAKAAASDANLVVSRLAKHHEFYQMLAEQIDDVIVNYDLRGQVEYASPSIRKFGYAPSEVVGRNTMDFIVLPPGVETSLSVLERGQPLPANNLVQFRRRDGSLVWIEGRPSPTYDDLGKRSGIVTVIRDVTERLEIERVLRQKTEDAEAAVVAKAQFLANMSHEIRTPLTSVLGFADLIAGFDGLPDPLPRFAEQIVRGGQTLLALVNDILDFSRLDAGGFEADPQPVQVRGLVGEVVEAMQPKAAERALELDANVAGDLPDWVTTDPQRLRQILTNLVGNALKFTAKGSIKIRVEQFDLNSEKLRFAVVDTGHGIPPDQIERIFQRFAQVDESNTRQFGGAGLGLAISKGLVELLGGEIGVESEVGRGSTFWFTISAPAASEPQEKLAETDVTGELGPLRVLMVDDVDQNRELVRVILSSMDVELTEAADGEEAVEAANKARFDIILMDIQMPKLDGRAATRAIRANSAFNKTTPILALSADVLPQHIEACEAAGMNDHIGKPINLGTLLHKIDLWTS